MNTQPAQSIAANFQQLWTQTMRPGLLNNLVDLITRASGRERTNFAVRAPAVDEPIVEVPACTQEDVILALNRARKAQQEWAESPVRERKQIVLRLHDLILQRQETMLDLLQMETGKARRDALEEVLDVAQACRHYAFRAESYLQPKWRKGALPLLTRTWELRHPIGVVGFISPWNYPLTLTLSDAIPAMLAGNAVVVKPDSQAPLAALLGLQWLREAGLPGDVLQVVTGPGADLAKPLIAGVDYICFTGSTTTGRSIARQAGENLIGCSLELGGKNPMLVLHDADIDRAVHGALRGCFANAGQLCISCERLFLQDPVYDRFLHQFIKRTSNLKIGPEKNFDVGMGSLISRGQLDKVDAHVRDAVRKGAVILAGGRARPDLGPFFYEPTILARVTQEMRVWQEETFGPVVSVCPFGDIEEALRMANDSPFGLNASIWTRDVRQGQRLAVRMRCGTVNINGAYAAAWGSVDAPMGGMKASGIGRRHGVEGFARFTESQTIAQQNLIPVGPWPFVKAGFYARVMTAALRLLRHIPGLR
ncbi:succinic semialdehyde dehydrogenase [Desulfoferrobacter suflitae]|uniref:succinic semialdehyde dehydrogenase n=1 Tax=Desulfoferrobacter suflitae TaxID=2865782 RepID=UPI002164C568|nr:succinic semialdehyde dehydrogenase [Desulfoferrobacter suflitae]MCK8602091.1 succinic semialdehyde dehydrogenase [Desulfoferrobacter suflitae]